MRRNCLFLLIGMLAVSSLCLAQKPLSDAQYEHLKGNVKTVLTTTRTPQGRVVGQPVRNFYNRDGFFNQVTYYDTTGFPAITVKYEYDKKNRLVKDTRYLEPYSELISQTTYAYDKKRNRMEAHFFGISDSIIETTVYHYNKASAIDTVTSFDDSGKELYSTVYLFDKHGDKQYATFTEGPNHIYRGTEKYRYDTEGDLAEHCSYYLTTLRQAFLYSYIYDEQGNWTEAYVFHVSPTEGYLYQIITRQITYYED